MHAGAVLHASFDLPMKNQERRQIDPNRKEAKARQHHRTIRCSDGPP
jgi:hypothetical protein